MRKPIVIGNWKMNKTFNEAIKLASEIKLKKLDSRVDKVICIPNLYANYISNLLKDIDISVGVQNVYYENYGAFTGEISSSMIKSCGLKYVIIGHSERRTIFGENDEIINKKVISTLRENIIPIICCGETFEQREKKIEKQIIENQIRNAFINIDKNDIINCCIAYEPIWAIGTGLTASPIEAEDMIFYIRNIINDIYGSISENIRIIYGGSVKPSNILDIMNKENIDGVLVGGACLQADSFEKIINFKL